MKIISSLTLALLVSTGTIAAQASGVDQGELEECKSQMADYYGAGVETKLVKQRHYRDGTRISIAVSNEDAGTHYSTTRIATCWIPNYDAQAANWGDTEESMVADIGVTVTDQER